MQKNISHLVRSSPFEDTRGKSLRTLCKILLRLAERGKGLAPENSQFGGDVFFLVLMRTRTSRTKRRWTRRSKTLAPMVRTKMIRVPQSAIFPGGGFVVGISGRVDGCAAIVFVWRHRRIVEGSALEQRVDHIDSVAVLSWRGHGRLRHLIFWPCGTWSGKGRWKGGIVASWKMVWRYMVFSLRSEGRCWRSVTDQQQLGTRTNSSEREQLGT